MVAYERNYPLLLWGVFASMKLYSYTGKSPVWPVIQKGAPGK
jgi:hypothetical protein